MVSVGRPTWAEIDLSAIGGNIRTLKTLVSQGTRFCAVVKADAYGHGAVAVAAEALRAGADYLAVAILDEALTLRAAGFTCPILILGFTPSDQASIVVRNGLTQTIFNFEQAMALSAAATSLRLIAKAHLKVDTGMGRLGIMPAEAPDFVEAADKLPNFLMEGVFTHFAQADSHDKKHAENQFKAFNAALSAISERGLDIPIKHCANSAALLDMPHAHLDMVRAGICIYGLWPSAETSRPVKLKPAMRFKSTVAMLKRVPAGTAVSYGGTYVAKAPAIIGTLPVGYADGWTRMLSNKAEVMLGGLRVPVVGRICMDQCLIDATAVNGASEGDEVLLFGGPELPVEELAGRLGTIGYEIVCMVGKRVPRVYFGGKAS